MQITVKPYMRRDGSVMVYLNNDRGVSLGLSPEYGYQSSKATVGGVNVKSDGLYIVHDGDIKPARLNA